MAAAQSETVLIVGAGAGLSASLARALARDGAKLALAARDIGKLQELCEATGAQAFACDAADPGQVERLFEAVDASLGPPDVVVYNASGRARGNESLLALRQGIFILTVMNQSDAPPMPRGRPRGFDREQALDAAMRLFWSRGYEATSISELTEAMGITPPSLYSAFGNKKRLFLEAVDRYQEASGGAARAALTEEPTAEQAVRRLMLAAVDAFAGARTPKGCLVVLGATNCSPDSADVFEAMADRRRAGAKAVRQRLAVGQAAGELAEGTDVDALADLITATVFGVAIKARDGVSKKALKASVEQFMTLWPRRPA